MPEVMLAPTPKYISRKLNGQPNIGGYLETYVNQSTDHKATYEDPEGLIPNTWPVHFDGQGEANIYWLKDDTLYTIKEYDADGNLINTQDNYPVVGSNTTNYVDESQSNVLRNAQFSFWSYGTTFTLGSGNTGSQNNNDFICDDWLYQRDGTAANVTISADPISLSDTSLITGNPIYFFKYEAGGAVGGNYSKLFQRFNKVQTFAGRNISFAIEAKSPTSSTINIYAVQNFGTGGSPSAEVKTLLKQIPLTTTLTRYASEGIPIPSIGGKTLGTDDNDAFILQIEFPTDIAGTVQLVNAQLAQNDVINPFPIETYNQQSLELISKIYNAVPKTSFTIATLKNAADEGWLMCDDGTIGAGGSGADHVGVSLKALYNLIWAIPNKYAPIYDSSGAITTRGVNADADFTALKRLALTRTVGRILASAGTAKLEQTFTVDPATDVFTCGDASGAFYTSTPVTFRNVGGSLPGGISPSTTYYAVVGSGTTFKIANTQAEALDGVFKDITTTGSGTNFVTIDYTGHVLGQWVGEQSHALNVNEIPSHEHSGSTQGIDLVSSIGSAQVLAVNKGLSTQEQVSNLTIASNGGDLSHNNMQPTSFWNYMIKI